MSPAVPEHETAWERGSKRRKMDVEYEEKKTSQSLTQVRQQ